MYYYLKKEYSGDWVNDKPNGKATYDLKYGGKYVGDTKDGFYNGNGSYTWPNGNTYLG